MTEYVVFLTGGEDDEQAMFVTEDVGDGCRLTCVVRGEKFMAQERDFFDALRVIRRRALQPKGLMPFCYGASLNVWPSGMSRDMGLGLKAYKTVIGAPAAVSVGIFEEGADVIPSSVANQEAFHSDWIASLKG